MFNYNSNHIFIGYLKELLNSFNLPKYQVYTKEDVDYFKTNGQESPNILDTVLPEYNLTGAKEESNNSTWIFNYIKDGKIQSYNRYLDKDTQKYEWKWSDRNTNFYVGKKDLANTKNLLLKTTTYDSYTHKYLGDYLRFMRDYYGINLMPFYNCFTDNVISNINLPITKASGTIEFNSLDLNYKLYCIPVKLFQKYTIAIDSATGFEACCCFYNEELRQFKISSDFINASYKHYAKTYFHAPVIYDFLAQTIKQPYTDNGDPAEVYNPKSHNTIEYNRAQSILAAKSEQFLGANLFSELPSLVLVLKVPVAVTSSITILEGDYTGYNNIIFKRERLQEKNPYFVLGHQENRWVTNYEKLYRADGSLITMEDRPFKPITHLQLLEWNTQKSYPFADRLVEYLLSNAIFPESSIIPDNVKRIQKILTLQQAGYKVELDGVWDDEIRRRLYDYMHMPEYWNLKNKLSLSSTQDCLGYCDKDVEKYCAAWKDGKVISSISTVDIYKELD